MFQVSLFWSTHHQPQQCCSKELVAARFFKSQQQISCIHWKKKSVINNGRSIFRGPLRSSTMHNDVCTFKLCLKSRLERPKKWKNRVIFSHARASFVAICQLLVLEWAIFLQPCKGSNLLSYLQNEQDIFCDLYFSFVVNRWQVEVSTFK